MTARDIWSPWDEAGPLDELQVTLSSFAEACPHIPGEPHWPDPGVSVLLTDHENRAWCGVWCWDGKRWSRPTEAEFRAVLPE